MTQAEKRARAMEVVRSFKTEEESRHAHPQRNTRPQPEIERSPDWYQRTKESIKDGRGFDGGTWAGRDFGGGRDR
jgi:hypothetical protein